MTMLTRSERLALLLNLLGDDAKTLARTGLARRIARRTGDSIKLTSKTIRQARKKSTWFSMILKTISSCPCKLFRKMTPGRAVGSRTAAPTILQIAEEHFNVEWEPTKKFERQSLPETPSRLESDASVPGRTSIGPRKPRRHVDRRTQTGRRTRGKNIEFLPAANRPSIFLKLAQPSTAKPLVHERVFEQPWIWHLKSRNAKVMKSLRKRWRN